MNTTVGLKIRKSNKVYEKSQLEKQRACKPRCFFVLLVVTVLTIRTSRSFILRFVLGVLLRTAIFFRMLCHESSLQIS